MWEVGKPGLRGSSDWLMFTKLIGDGAGNSDLQARPLPDSADGAQPPPRVLKPLRGEQLGGHISHPFLSAGSLSTSLPTQMRRASPDSLAQDAPGEHPLLRNLAEYPGPGVRDDGPAGSLGHKL